MILSVFPGPYFVPPYRNPGCGLLHLLLPIAGLLRDGLFGRELKLLDVGFNEDMGDIGVAALAAVLPPTLEHIVFSEYEDTTQHETTPNPIRLSHMPTTIVLRALGARWVLPAVVLPKLPKDIDRRGLFQIEAGIAYFKHSMSLGKASHKGRGRPSSISVDVRVRRVQARPQAVAFDRPVDRRARGEVEDHRGRSRVASRGSEE